MSCPDDPDETSDERPGSPPDSHDESLAKLKALMDEAIRLAERHAARRG
jgi:hypothetical protein